MENWSFFNQSYRHTQPDTLGLSPHTYCWEIWNATGNSSPGNLPEHNNFSDLWINIHLPPTQLLSTLQLELSNIQDIYNSGESTITSAIQLLNSNQPQTCIHCRRSLLPFLGDALSWLTGTATTKDIHSIKTQINQLIATQTSQHNTLVHVVSILNITRYTTQVNRHSINTLIDAVCTTSQDINNLYNLTTSLATSINFNQMILHIRSVFANL